MIDQRWTRLQACPPLRAEAQNDVTITSRREPSAFTEDLEDGWAIYFVIATVSVVGSDNFALGSGEIVEGSMKVLMSVCGPLQ